MISSDKILTLVDPKQTLLNDYLELIKWDFIQMFFN
jgi:hypothetical protein